MSFRTIIDKTAFSSEAANQIFEGKIYGETFRGDVSLLSLLRALLGQKIPDGEKLVLALSESAKRVSDLKDVEPKSVIDSILPARSVTKGTFMIQNVRDTSSGKENAIAVLDYLAEHFCEVRTSFEYIERSKKFMICDDGKPLFAAFVDKKNKKSVVFVRNMDIKSYHSIISLVPAFMPWYWDMEMPREERDEWFNDCLHFFRLFVHAKGHEEIEKITDNRAKEAEYVRRYQSILGKYAAAYDFRTPMLKAKLAGFESRFQKEELERLNSQIEDKRREFERLNNDITRVNSAMYDMQLRAFGLDAKIRSGEESNELLDFFISNKSLDFVSSSTRRFLFTVKTYIDIIDEDLCQKMLDNKGSLLYDRCRNDEEKEKFKKVLERIFIEQDFRIRSCAAYEFSLGEYVEGKEHNFDDATYLGYLPNPHIQRYQCLGSYKSQINEQVRRHDYIGAISTCMSSARNLNFGDTTVMGVFTRWFHDEDKFMCCVELPDGKVTDWMGAYSYIEEEEKKKAEAAKAEQPVEAAVEAAPEVKAEDK